MSYNPERFLKILEGLPELDVTVLASSKMPNFYDIKIVDIHSGKEYRVYDGKKLNKNDRPEASKKQLIQWLAHHSQNRIDGAFYEGDALELRNEGGNGGVGHSERAIRKTLGLSIDDISGSSDTLDIRDEGYEGEVKEIQGNDGSIIDVKFNRSAIVAWSECKSAIRSHNDYKLLSDVQIASIEEGKLSLTMIESMPIVVRDMIHDMLQASRVLKHEKRIYCGLKDCYITINQDDYDVAWRLSQVTLGGCIKYKLERRYLVQRVCDLLESDGFSQTVRVPFKLNQHMITSIVSGATIDPKKGVFVGLPIEHAMKMFLDAKNTLLKLRGDRNL